MYIWQVTNLTLKRNHFYRCAIMDVFITGGAVANGGYIENNVFEKPSPGSLAFHFRNGPTTPPPTPTTGTSATTRSSARSSLGDNPVGPGGMRLIGNAFLSEVPSCGHADTSWSHNAFTSGPCGPGAITRPLSTFLAGFASTESYALKSTSVLRDKGDAKSYPRSDRSGRARFAGSGPDIGASEFR